MRGRNALLLVALMGLAALSGCANARHLQVDRDSGIVSMPANTNCWPHYYRDHAEALMRQKCPAGYEVVREEEAVVGQVAHTHTDTQTQAPPTFGLGGIQADGDKRDKTGSAAFAGLAIPLGTTKESKQQTTNYDDVTEWRIYYQAKSPAAPNPANPPGAPAPPNPLNSTG
jgi:hypothetical protein